MNTSRIGLRTMLLVAAAAAWGVQGACAQDPHGQAGHGPAGNGPGGHGPPPSFGRPGGAQPSSYGQPGGGQPGPVRGQAGNGQTGNGPPGRGQGAFAGPARPAAVRPPPGRFNGPSRPFVDGRGQVMDSRYRHGRFYPRIGTVARTLPPDYRPYYHGGSPYYFSGGTWYAPRTGGFVVITPPAGLVIATLPVYYSTVWFAGTPYYYADNVYYTWAPDQSGYAVVAPPAGALPPDDDDSNQDASGDAPPPPAQSDLIVYPANGQSADQQAADQYECHGWARGQTGFDPTQPNGGVSQADADRARGNYDRAMAACLTGRGYQVN